MAQSLTSPQYKSYSVKEQHKLRANVDVNLGKCTFSALLHSVLEQDVVLCCADENLDGQLTDATCTITGISGECIQIDPVGSRTLFRSKAVTYDIEDIASCAVHGDKRSSG